MMEESRTRSFPRWLFAILAIGGLLASGIYIGIMSVEGFAGMRLVQAAAFGLLGLLMFWGAIQPPAEGQ
jgi:hypothetical protein